MKRRGRLGSGGARGHGTSTCDRTNHRRLKTVGGMLGKAARNPREQSSGMKWRRFFETGQTIIPETTRTNWISSRVWLPSPAVSGMSPKLFAGTCVMIEELALGSVLALKQRSRVPNMSPRECVFSHDSTLWQLRHPLTINPEYVEAPKPLMPRASSSFLLSIYLSGTK